MQMQQAINVVARIFEAAGVGALVIGSGIALGSFALAFLGPHRAPPPRMPHAYGGLRRGLGRAILLGLELLVIADIIRSIAIAPTLQSVGVLGLIVLIRTFLSWAFEVELTGRWPWRRAQPGAAVERHDEPRAR